MRHLIIILFALNIPLWSIAQFAISGKVYDKETGKSLPGASVVIDETFISTSAASDGSYTLKKLKTGNHSLKVSYIGYKTVIKNVDLKADLVLDFELLYSSVLSDEVIIRASRVNENSPTTYSTIDKALISENNTGQDLPYILQLSPSVVTSSDAGAGVGYTGIRIRGTDITRINVTMNGVPINDAESQGVYFVDLPDLASSINSIQIQRGVGTSSNGPAAFGASINIETTKLNPDPYAEINSTAGSFNTFKNTVNFGSGIINGKWAFDGRLSAINSDGYIERASSNLRSYFVSGGYYGEKSILKAIISSGREKTYQAWNGTPKDSLKTNRRYNPSGEILDDNGAVIDYYNNQTDNYQQDYYQLHFAHQFDEHLSMSSTLFYTKGRGYYESFKNDKSFEDYGYQDVIIGADTISKTDMVNQKWLDNDYAGINLSVNYTKNKVDVTFGAGGNHYQGDHFGYITWAQYASNSFPEKPWYENTGYKDDAYFFGKVNFQAHKKLNIYADLQFRNIVYQIKGTHDDLRDLTQKHSFNFFNPKAGIYYSLNEKSSIYASIAVANREPNRSVYRDADSGQIIKPERLVDYELGYKFNTNRIALETNLYYMDYKDQLVLTGQINNVGDAILVNVPNSYRTGIEIVAGFNLLRNLKWEVNGTFSQNKIKGFVSYIDNWDTWGQEVDSLGTTDISFSPDIIAGSNLTYIPVENLKISFISRYVGRQYIDNTSSKNHSLDPYFVNDLKLYYSIKTNFIKQIDLWLSLNNVFDTEYVSNAWVYRYYSENIENEYNGYFSQAKFNFMAGLTLKF